MSQKAWEWGDNNNNNISNNNNNNKNNNNINKISCDIIKIKVVRLKELVETSVEKI